MATVGEKMTAIADAIREKTLETDPLTLDAMAEKISLVSDLGYLRGKDDGWEEGNARGYSLGKADENLAWWDLITAKGTKVYYQALFRGADFNLVVGGFNPPYTLKPLDSMDNMFRLAKGLTKVTKSQLDTSSCKSGNSTFEGSDLQEIEELSVAGYNNGLNIQWHFYGCTQLHTIGKFILKDDGSQTLTKNFFNATNLQNITIEGKIGTSEDFSSCSKLTVESLMSILDALYDYSGTSTTRTLTLHADAKAKLSESDIAIATQKGWTIA